MTRLKPKPTPLTETAGTLCEAIRAEHDAIRVTAPARQAARARTVSAIADVEAALKDGKITDLLVAGPLRRLIGATLSETLMTPLPRQGYRDAAAARASTVGARREASYAWTTWNALECRADTLNGRRGSSANSVGDEGVPRDEVRHKALMIIAFWGTRNNASVETGINAHVLTRAASEEPGWCTRESADAINAAFQVVRRVSAEIAARVAVPLSA